MLDSLTFQNAERAVGAAHEGNLEKCVKVTRPRFFKSLLVTTTTIFSFLCLSNMK